MLNKKISFISGVFSIIIISLVVGLGIHFVIAWTGPSASPPDGNVSPPITTAGGQTIGGNLTITGNLNLDSLSLHSASDYLNYGSNLDTVSRMAFKDAQLDNYGSVYGSGDGAYFGLLDGDGNWSYLAAKDSYTAFRVNNIERMRIDTDSVDMPGDLNVDGQICMSGDCRSSWSSGGSGFVWKSSPTTLSFTEDGAWHDIDLTSATSSNASYAIISWAAWNTQDDHIVDIRFRKNGSSSTWEAAAMSGGDAPGRGSGQFIMALDSGQIMEYKVATKHVYGFYEVEVVGYIE
ncbi:MAG: hypothetical protein GF387_01585 [Candidatus Portnoybacteria bacterium]|nr:hypothetical protein [Candidatus Portnoybacteria bacterium]